MKKLPQARTENILEQNLENETLIYDLTIDKAFNLNETLSVVYKACGQNLTFDELKRKHKFTDEFIYLALDELKRENLLAEDYQSPFADVNRREVIRKVGLATMFAMPVVIGFTAPQAVQASSTCPTCVDNRPSGCRFGGTYNLGCFNDPFQCFDYADQPSTRSVCCRGFFENTSYDNQTRCCSASCPA